MRVADFVVFRDFQRVLQFVGDDRDHFSGAEPAEHLRAKIALRAASRRDRELPVHSSRQVASLLDVDDDIRLVEGRNESRESGRPSDAGLNQLLHLRRRAANPGADRVDRAGRFRETAGRQQNGEKTANPDTCT